MRPTSIAVLVVPFLFTFALAQQSTTTEEGEQGKLSARFSLRGTTVSSNAPFTLRGASVDPGLGVASFPVMAGDSIRAGKAPIVIQTQGSDPITLAPGSEAIVQGSGGSAQVQIVSGSFNSTREVALDSKGKGTGNNPGQGDPGVCPHDVQRNGGVEVSPTRPCGPPATTPPNNQVP